MRKFKPTIADRFVAFKYAFLNYYYILGLVLKLGPINTVRKIRQSGESEVDWSKASVEEVKASTIADSISVDRPRDGLAAVKAIIESGGETVTLSDEDILAAIPEMARLSGVFPEPAAAAPWAAVKQMVRDDTIESDELVVCLVSGSGLKDTGSARKAAGEPRVIDPSIDAVREALH